MIGNLFDRFILNQKALLAIAGVLLATGFLPVFRLYASYHWKAENLNGLYSLSPFIVVVSGFALWHNREAFLATQGSRLPGWFGYSLLIFGTALKLVGEVEGFTVLRGITLLPITIGIIALIYPASSVRKTLFPVLYLLFAIPMPPMLLDELTRPALLLSAWTIEQFLILWGDDFSRQGFAFILPDAGRAGFQVIELVEGCSGIRSLFSIAAIVSLYLYLTQSRVRRALLLATVAILLGILGNLFRISGTIFISWEYGAEVGQSFFHSYSAYLVLAGVLGILFWIERWIK